MINFFKKFLSDHQLDIQKKKSKQHIQKTTNNENK